MSDAHEPDFDELVGDDLEPAERARLLRVHDLLVAAGPPPELSPQLASAPKEPKATVIPFPRSRWRTAALTAAAAVLIAFGIGYGIGAHGNGLHVQRTVSMAGPNGARASIAVLRVDKAGNWPMELKVSGLPALAHGHTYTLWLTKHGKLEAPCGTFAVRAGTTTVRLNAPYHLTEYSGWVVVRSGTTQPLLRTATV